MKKAIILAILVGIILIPAVSLADVDAKLQATYKAATVTVTRIPDKKGANKDVTLSCRVVVVYQKTDLAVFDDKREVAIGPNAAKIFNFDFKNKTAGSGKYYVLTIVRNAESGMEIFKIMEVVSP